MSTLRPVALIAAAILTLTACQSVPAGTAGDASPAAALSSGFQTSSGRIDRGQALALAAVARDACAEHMPDTRATRAAFDAAGLPSHGSEGRIWLHSPSLFDIAAFVNTSAAEPRCGIIVRGMTQAEATTLIQPWIEIAGVDVTQGQRRRNNVFWDGQFKGGPVRLGIVDEINLSGFIRGGAIVAQAR